MILHYMQINVVHRINELRKKMIISIDAEKVSDKIQHPFMTKTFQKVGQEENYLNILRDSILRSI